MVNVKPLIVKIPEHTSATLEGNRVNIIGPKGELKAPIEKKVSVTIENGNMFIKRLSDDKQARALQGLTRALIANAIHGVTQGFMKTLELSGVGFRAQVLGDELTLSVGFSHPVRLKAPEGILLGVSENKISISGIDKQLVGQVAQTIRHIRPPEPYKGKGIRYEGEKIRRKAGKAAVKTAGAK